MNVRGGVGRGGRGRVGFVGCRRLLFSPPYATFVCGSRFAVVVRSSRIPPKNQRRSLSTGPPAIPSYSGESVLGRVVRFSFSRGVRALQDTFVRFVRNGPENQLPPLPVTTF